MPSIHTQLQQLASISNIWQYPYQPGLLGSPNGMADEDTDKYGKVVENH